MPTLRTTAKRFLRAVESVLGDAVRGWADHNAPQIAAALSYYALLSWPHSCSSA